MNSIERFVNKLNMTIYGWIWGNLLAYNGMKCFDHTTNRFCEFYRPNKFVFFTPNGLKEVHYSYYDLGKFVYNN